MEYIIQGPKYDACFKMIESYAEKLKECLLGKIIDDPIDLAFHIGSCFNIACEIVGDSSEQVAQTHQRYKKALEHLDSVIPILSQRPGLLRHLKLEVPQL